MSENADNHSVVALVAAVSQSLKSSRRENKLTTNHRCELIFKTVARVDLCGKTTELILQIIILI